MTGPSRVKVRRYGSGRTHYADIPDTLIRPTIIAGRDCRTVTPPVAALCGVVLGSTTATAAVVVMRDHVTVGCRACVRIAALTPAADRG